MTANYLLRIGCFIGLLGILCAAFTNASHAQSADHPLQPPRTDSPRATLFGFIKDLERAYQFGGNDQGEASQLLIARGVRHLDLSKIPPKLAKSRGTEAALLLKEVLDRIALPAADAVPGPDQGSQAQAAAGATPPQVLQSWDIPHTEIEIGLVSDGERAGEYLFTPETVSRIREYYNRTRHLPYKQGATPNIYQAYQSTPGNGLELRWGRMFPEWSKHTIGGHALWQWIGSSLTLIAMGIMIRLLTLLGTHIDKPLNTSNGSVSHKWRPATSVAIVLALAVCGAAEWFIGAIVNLSGSPFEVLVVFIALIQYALLCWLIVLVVRQITEIIIGLRRLDTDTAGGQLMRLFGLMVTCGLIVTVVVFAGQDFGLPTYSLVTGLGVGGIAIGFGAQSLVRDVFSGILFLIDDAFRVGEYVEIDGTVGTVDKISIRSLRLRHPRGALHVIPYGEIRKLTNNSRDWVIVKLKFTVPFETDVNKVRKIFKKIGQAMYEDNPYYAENIIEPFKLQGVYNVDDIGIVVRGKFMAKPGTQFIIRKDVYARVQKAFDENGIEFARKEVRVKVPGLEDATHLDTAQKEAIAGAAAQAADPVS